METVALTAVWRRPEPIHVDITSLSDDGLLRVRRSRFGSVLPSAGRRVLFVDSVNEVRGVAFMVNWNSESDLVYLDVEWDLVEDAPGLDTTVVYAFRQGVVMEPQPKLIGAFA